MLTMENDSRNKFIDYNSVRWFAFMGKLYNMDNYLHSGGNYILKHCIRKDITKMMDGYLSMPCYDCVSQKIIFV